MSNSLAEEIAREHVKSEGGGCMCCRDELGDEVPWPCAAMRAAAALQLAQSLEDSHPGVPDHDCLSPLCTEPWPCTAMNAARTLRESAGILQREGRQMTREQAAIEAIRRAIQDEGPQPAFHRATMARHRKEWPTLWAAIDAALSASPPTSGTGGSA